MEELEVAVRKQSEVMVALAELVRQSEQGGAE